MKQRARSLKVLCPRRSEQVVWKILDGKGILLNLQDGAYFEANPVGLAVWQQCDGLTDPAKIARGVSKKFRVGLDQATRDVAGFVRELLRRKLLRG